MDIPNIGKLNSNNSCCAHEYDNCADTSERLSNCSLSPSKSRRSLDLTDKKFLMSSSKSKTITDQYLQDNKASLKLFDSWNEREQIDFVQQLLTRMCHYQHGQINSFLKPMLQRDFISALPARGLDHVAERILSYLDADSLRAAELVCREWERVIADGMLWKKLIEYKVTTDTLWAGLAERVGWINFLRIRGRRSHTLLTSRDTQNGSSWPISPSSPSSLSTSGGFMNMTLAGVQEHHFYRQLYPKIIKDIEAIEENWRRNEPNISHIQCHSETSKGVYCLQYDDQKIVSGLRDNTIKIWDRATLQCTEVLSGHMGSVLCLQYDENVIISGSSDATVRIWSIRDYQCLNTLFHHCEAVLHLRFADGVMVSCSKDRSIAVWDMFSPEDIRLRRVLVGHRAAVNVVDFDRKYIVSASGDRTIKVWNTASCEFVRTLSGHKRGIACLQYRDRLVVSGSSDNSIRLWDIEMGNCLRILEGHDELVRCIRFDNKRIVSGAYDGKIKVWDLKAALDPRSPTNSLCIRTLDKHTGRVFRLQFDEFQIVSSSHDDSILIWDFLNVQDKPLCSSTVIDNLQAAPVNNHQQSAAPIQVDNFNAATTTPSTNNSNTNNLTSNVTATKPNSPQ